MCLIVPVNIQFALICMRSSHLCPDLKKAIEVFENVNSFPFPVKIFWCDENAFDFFFNSFYETICGFEVLLSLTVL